MLPQSMGNGASPIDRCSENLIRMSTSPNHDGSGAVSIGGTNVEQESFGLDWCCRHIILTAKRADVSLSLGLVSFLNGRIDD